MRLLIVVAAVCIAASANAAAVGGDPCRRGPSYWCSSVQTAVSCNAFTHCLQTVWEPQLMDVQQTEACLSTQEMVETARRVRSVDGKIHGPLVTSLCKSAEDEETKEGCQNTVTKFLPQVMSLLESTMESSSLSALLGLCRQYEEEAAVDPEYSDASQSAHLCQDCDVFLRDARELLKTPGAEKVVITLLENDVCPKFNDLEIWCKAVVDVGVPKLLKYIEENDGAEMLCGLTSVCTETEDRKMKKHYWSDIMDQVLSLIEVDTDSQVVCHDCDKVLTSVLTFAKDSPVRTSFEHTIAHLCSLTSLNEETCRLLSEGFSGIPEDLLHSASVGVDVPYVCQSLVGCRGGESDQSEQSPSVSSPDLSVPVVSPVSLSENRTPDSTHCPQCERVLDDVRQVLTTESAVVQATMQAKQTLCQHAGSLEDQCNTMVNVFAPVLVDWLAKTESPRFVCSQLNVCPTPDMKSLDLVKIFGSIWHKDRLAEVASLECDVCYVLMEEIIAADRNPDVQSAIVDFFNGLCDKLGQEAAQCKALVAQYAPDLFEILANELDPTTVCELLMSCTKQTTEEEEAVPKILPETVLIGQPPMINEEAESQEHVTHMTKKAKNSLKQTAESVECSVCRLAMETIDKVIVANSTEEKLNQLLGEVCSLLPAEDQEPCEQLVDSFAHVILQLLVQQMDPLMICDELQLCSKASPMMVPLPPVRPAAEQREDVEGASESVQCELCQVVVAALDEVLAQNRTEAAVEKALDEVCGVIPKDYQSQCLSLVDQYSSVLVELLLQELQPQQVCVFISLCQQKDVEIKNVVNVALPEVHDTPEPIIMGDANSSHNRKQSSGEVCLVCQTLVGFLKEAINQQPTEDELQKLLEDVCTLLPDNLTATCDMIVEQFTPLILQLLEEKINPLEICQSVKLCSPEAHEGRLQIGAAVTERDDEGRVEVERVGEDSCTYGPGFWCASMDNARKCGMVRECVEKYGMKP